MKIGCHEIPPRGFDLHNVRLEEMQAFRTTILKARLGEFRKMFFHGRWMQRDVSTQKRKRRPALPLCALRTWFPWVP